MMGRLDMSVRSFGNSRWAAFAVGCTLVLGLGPLTAAPQDKTEKQIVVAIVSGALRPVTGVAAGDVTVKEDGQERKVLKVEPFTAPMSVVLLADTTNVFVRYKKELQASSKSFFSTFMAGHAGSSAALWEFGGAAMPVKGFTSDAAELDRAASSIEPKEEVARVTSEQKSALLTGVFDAANELAKRAETRRVIVSFNATTPLEIGKLTAKQIQEALEKANASWFGVVLQDGGTSSPMRETLMAEQIPASGGIKLSVKDPADLEGAVKALATVLNSQYVVTYSRPSGSAKQVEVTVNAPGVLVKTPKWAPK
jgi:hypothetical protein